jgi:hypothetical protein
VGRWEKKRCHEHSTVGVGARWPLARNYEHRRASAHLTLVKKGEENDTGGNPADRTARSASARVPRGTAGIWLGLETRYNAHSRLHDVYERRAWLYRRAAIHSWKTSVTRLHPWHVEFAWATRDIPTSPLPTTMGLCGGLSSRTVTCTFTNDDIAPRLPAHTNWTDLQVVVGTRAAELVDAHRDDPGPSTVTWKRPPVASTSTFKGPDVRANPRGVFRQPRPGERRKRGRLGIALRTP